MSRLAIPVILALALPFAAHAQLPSGQGQMPGTLPPAAPVTPPPPLAIPAPVPSVVTPIPSPTYGVPPGVTGRVTGSGIAPIVRYQQPAKRKFKRRHRHTSELPIIGTI